MAAFDGSIRIDSRIDPTGFNRGLDALKASAGRAAASIRFGFVATGTIIGAVFKGIAIMLRNIVVGVIGALVVGLLAMTRMQVRRLDDTVVDLEHTLGDVRNAFAAAFMPILPIVQILASWLVKVLNTIGMIIAALLGQKMVWQAVEGGAAAAAASTEKMADNTAKAKKEAKGALAAFDDINVLQQPEDPAPTTGGGGGAGPVAGMGEGFALVPVDNALLARLDALKAKLSELFGPAKESWDRFMLALEPLKEEAWKGLVWIWDNILVPLGTWVMEDALPAFLDLLAAAADTLVIAIDALKPLWEDIWEILFEPAAEWTGDAIVDGLRGMTEKFKELGGWIQNNEKAFRALWLILVLVLAAFLLISSPIAAIIALVIGIVVALANAGKAWENFKTLISLGLLILKTLWQNTVHQLQAAWWGMFNGIYTFTKGIINKIIDLINGMIRAIVGGINAVIGALNGISVTIPSWVPGFGGENFGFSIPTVDAPRIPKLATGAVIPPNAEFAAILGDQRSGRNIETPENLLRQIVREELQGMGGEQKVIIEFGDDAWGKLIRELQPRIKQENARIGGSLVKTGAITR